MIFRRDEHSIASGQTICSIAIPQRLRDEEYLFVQRSGVKWIRNDVVVYTFAAWPDYKIVLFFTFTDNLAIFLVLFILHSGCGIFTCPNKIPYPIRYDTGCWWSSSTVCEMSEDTESPLPCRQTATPSLADRHNIPPVWW